MAKKKGSGRKRTRRAAKTGDRKYTYAGSGPVRWVPVRVPVIDLLWWVSWFEDPAKPYQNPMQYKPR